MWTFLIRSENDSFVDVKKNNIWILIWSQSDRRLTVGGTSLCHLANDMDKY